MTSFEFTIIVLLATIVVLLIVLLRTAIEGFHGVWQKLDANWEQLRKIETHTNFLADISQQLDNIEDNILDDRRDIVAMLASINDMVDKMHRNICADVAEKMVDRAFPIKEGEPLDKSFVPQTVTPWPPCYWGGSCTNPHRDCVNCPRPNVSGGTWTTTGNKVELTDNDKSANSVSITEGRTDVTDGTLPEGAIIMQ